MRTFLRGKVTLLFIVCAVLIAVPAIVLADELRNDLDSSFDADFEVLGLQTDASQDVNLVLQVQGGNTENNLTSPAGTGGENNCNIGGTQTIEVQAVSSSSAASVKWVDTGTDKITFTGCNAPNSKDL